MTRVLLVDDEQYYLHSMRDELAGEPYEIDLALDGAEAWEALRARPGEYACVVLDRKMPRIDGMELLHEMKADSSLAMTPVVLQTSVSAPEDVVEGLRAGAYYYLAKPFAAAVLRAVVFNAIAHGAFLKGSADELGRYAQMMQLLAVAEFRFRTLGEARTVAAAAASLFPDPQRALLGLGELMVNAIEHGNLGIGYARKSQLLESGEWESELERRLATEPWCTRSASLRVTRRAQEIELTIADEGEGFDWRRYLEMDPARSFDAHGRGIALARILAFHDVEFLGKGNVAAARIPLAAA